MTGDTGKAGLCPDPPKGAPFGNHSLKQTDSKGEPLAESRGRASGLACLLLAFALAGCDLAPRYDPPRMLLPADYQGSGPFTVARPDDAAPRGPWWEVFGDPVLDRLEVQASTLNPNLQAAAQQYVQARDLAAEARAGLFPQVGADGNSNDNRQSAHRLFRASPSSGPSVESSNRITGTASWMPDVWEAISNRTRIQKRLAQGSAATLAGARLSIQAELATDYMALRGLDTEGEVLRRTIGYYQTAVDITTLREAGKIASGLDVARARNQLAAAEVTETDVAANRAVLQHAHCPVFLVA